MAPGKHVGLLLTWILAELGTLWRCLNRDTGSTGQPRQPSDPACGPSFPDESRKPREIHRWAHAFCLRSTALVSQEASMGNLRMLAMTDGTETGSANGGAPVPCRWVFSKVSGSHFLCMKSATSQFALCRHWQANLPVSVLNSQHTLVHGKARPIPSQPQRGERASGPPDELVSGSKDNVTR
ncbi:predicted protein [Chaetomium globosum CBS 148.51]|uniref:Secreted protein n=1 Tax=Chaetomium globosum (strain ATCC 6205 / CBS 148.51 / DSM 1962 / NBRC 6347 / NRRL 1970) TaxID=306901 RepID=Q2HAB5_CHAGB|nr:uncharacterized protein CHGG_02839 [Chaetomium globosum CBS 148.51]EAQ90904.1 predicted protein [Chaetomium globosum CBS 148.51]